MNTLQHINVTDEFRMNVVKNIGEEIYKARFVPASKLKEWGELLLVISSYPPDFIRDNIDKFEKYI